VALNVKNADDFLGNLYSQISEGRINSGRYNFLQAAGYAVQIHEVNGQKTIAPPEATGGAIGVML